jgi:hypothetical protein
MLALQIFLVLVTAFSEIFCAPPLQVPAAGMSFRPRKIVSQTVLFSKATRRKLRGRFVHLTDFHPDPWVVFHQMMFVSDYAAHLDIIVPCLLYLQPVIGTNQRKRIVLAIMGLHLGEGASVIADRSSFSFFPQRVRFTTTTYEFYARFSRQALG